MKNILYLNIKLIYKTLNFYKNRKTQNIPESIKNNVSVLDSKIAHTHVLYQLNFPSFFSSSN
jgi:hypothetical protein